MVGFFSGMTRYTLRRQKGSDIHSGGRQVSAEHTHSGGRQVPTELFLSRGRTGGRDVRSGIQLRCFGTFLLGILATYGQNFYPN